MPKFSVTWPSAPSCALSSLESVLLTSTLCLWVATVSCSNCCDPPYPCPFLPVCHYHPLGPCKCLPPSTMSAAYHSSSAPSRLRAATAPVFAGGEKLGGLAVMHGLDDLGPDQGALGDNAKHADRLVDAVRGQVTRGHLYGRRGAVTGEKNVRGAWSLKREFWRLEG